MNGKENTIVVMNVHNNYRDPYVGIFLQFPKPQFFYYFIYEIEIIMSTLESCCED